MEGMIQFNFDRASLGRFNTQCNVAISKLQAGTKRALKEACEDIMKDSLAQVPRETQTLASSIFYEIYGSSGNFSAEVGYGKGGGINPRTGKIARYYMLAVHENLNAWHLIGKAKFLEDPVAAYARDRFPQTVLKHARQSLSSMTT